MLSFTMKKLKSKSKQLIKLGWAMSPILFQKSILLCYTDFWETCNKPSFKLIVKNYIFQHIEKDRNLTKFMDLVKHGVGNNRNTMVQSPSDT